MEPAPTDKVTRMKVPRETHAFWQKELEQSAKFLRKFHRQGTKIVQRYVDDRGNTDVNRNDSIFRLNLFHSNVKTIQNALYGQLPRVEASRTFADAQDDAARVAAEIIERINNLDIQEDGQSYDCILKSCLQDRLLPGNGVARVRYEVETEEVPVLDPMGVPVFDQEAEEPLMQEQVVYEDAPVEYYHWQDVMWGWCRQWSDMPWLGYRSYLSKDEVKERFPGFEDKVQYKTQKVSDSDDSETLPELDSPWQKAEIWEIWDKTLKQVVWYSQGCEKLLDKQSDPLELKGFYPSPPFLMANQTTTLYVPTADYHLAQDLYTEIDLLQTRISIITEAVKVVGLYNAGDEGNKSISRMFKEGVDNELIPVDNWAMFAEGGGLQGQIDWFPIGDVVGALDKLIGLRDQYIGLLQQVTGMADVMQGQLQSPYEGVGQSQIKAQFGSVRIQALQDEFARFVGDLFQIRSEIICKHFDPQTIVNRANMQYSMDRELIPQAIQLLKSPDMAHLRVQVRPETVAMEDFARLKSERTEFLNAMSTFMQSSAPMLQQEPQAMPYLLKMLQWSMSGFKGSSEIEGVLDKAVEGATQKAQQPQKPDPEQQKAQVEMQKIQAKTQADMQLRQQDLEADMQTALASHKAKMAEIAATHQARMAEIQAKAMADAQKEQISLQANVEQTVTAAESEMTKDAFNAELEIATEAEKSGMKIEEIAAGSATKIGEMVAQAELQPEEPDIEDE